MMLTTMLLAGFGNYAHGDGRNTTENGCDHIQRNEGGPDPNHG